jgi:sugar phosphate isomerase/epimerase
VTLRLAYNTNGWPQHELRDVVTQLAALGYAGIAVTPDVLQLNPFRAGAAEEARALRRQASDLGLAVAVETGARFVLDPARKHWPTLLDDPPHAARRLDYLRRCLDLAVLLRAETLSFWSGARPEGLSDEAVLERLCAGAHALLDAAAGSGVRVCLEPEPGMAVDGLEAAGDALLAVGREELCLMLDVGHVPVTEDLPPGEAILAFGPRLGGVQLDDCAGGRHEHLFFGEGEIDWPAVAAALRVAGFQGLASVELPRHVSDPVTTARRAIEFWRRLQA